MGQIVNRILTDTNNFIINGDMAIWQRGLSLTNNVTGVNGSANLYRQADRFTSYVSRVGSDVGATFTQTTDVPAGTSLTASTRITSNFSTAFGATAALLFPIYQRIEGTTVSQLQPGQDVWVSMYIKSSTTATLPIALVKMNTGNTEEQSYFWNESFVANVWKRVYRKITLPLTTIVKNTGTSFYITAGQCSGTGYSSYSTGPGGSWDTATLQLRNASSTNWADTSGNWIQVTGMMMSDQPHTSFALCGKSPLNELLLCQRYHERIGVPAGSSASYGFGIGVFLSSTNAAIVLPFVTKRGAPTIVFANPTSLRCNNATANYAVSAATSVLVTISTMSLSLTVAGAAGNSAFSLDTLSNAAFGVDAEL